MSNIQINVLPTNSFSQRETNKHLSTVSRLFSESVRSSSIQTMMAELNTTSAILEKIAVHKGLGSDTKNYARIVEGISKGYTIPAIMANPSLVGVPAMQHVWFKKFLEENPLPKAIVRPTRKRVRVVQVNLNNFTRNDNGDLVLPAEIAFQSESQLSEIFGSAGHLDEAGRSFVEMTHVVYTNLKLEDEENDEMKAIQKEALREGFMYKVDGVEYKASFFIQTASQARLLQGIFVAEDYMTIPDCFRALGHDFMAYSKRKWDGTRYIYTLDITKYLKRPGLSGTSTVESKAVSFKNARVVELENDEYMIVSDRHSIRVVADRFAKIKNGVFKAFYKNRVVKVTAVNGTFSASWTAHGRVQQEILPMDALTLGVGDGMLLADEEMYWALKAEFGVDSDAWQVRLTPFGKGLLVFVPGLRKYYDANIVAFKSAIKGDYRLMTDAEGNLKFNISLRIARFAKKPGAKAEYTPFPYQFTHVTSLTFDNMKSLIDPHLEQVKNVLSNPALIQKYAGVAHMENMDDMNTEEMDFMRQKSLVSTFSNFMHYAPFTFEDAWMQQQVLKLINEEVKKWVAGTIPVQGEYRFMVQDPYALLQAVRNENGEMIVQESTGLPADATFMMSRDNSHPMTGKTASLRNPAITKGEGRVLNAVSPQNYLTAAAKGAFSSVCVMSVHDLNTFAEGGADNDGDETFVSQEPILLNALSGKDGNCKFIPMLDLYVGKSGEWEAGCPFPMQSDEKLTFGADCVDYNGEFKVSFTADQYTHGFVQAVHELSKEYVIRTLNPNKIGYLTDIATRLADTVRKIGYMVAESVNENGSRVSRSTTEKEELISLIARYENMIDMLRLCIGWEIDRAKHGGAYEEQLAAELSFVENPPLYAGQMIKKKNVWINPSWLRHHKGKDGGMDTGSVISKLHAYMNEWVETNIHGKAAEVAGDVENNNLLHVFKAKYAIDPARVEMIKPSVKAIKFSYGKEMSELAATEQRRAFELDTAVLSPEALMEAQTNMAKEMSVLRGQCVEKHQMAMNALEAAYESHELGYVAYLITYTERGEKGNGAIGFPWSVAKKQFLDLCSLVSGRKVTYTTFIKEASDMKINYRVGQASNGRAFEADKMAAYLNNAKELFVEYVQHPMTGNWAHMVFIEVNGVMNYAGDVYKDQTAYFTGATKFKCTLSNAEAKKQTMFLQVSSIERM